MQQNHHPIDLEVAFPVRTIRYVLLALAILLMAAAYGLFGQSDAHPAFQAASIKRNPSDWSEHANHPMGMGVNSSLKLLIQFAYAPHDNPMNGHSLPLMASQVVAG